MVARSEAPGCVNGCRQCHPRYLSPRTWDSPPSMSEKARRRPRPLRLRASPVASRLCQAGGRSRPAPPQDATSPRSPSVATTPGGRGRATADGTGCLTRYPGNAERALWGEAAVRRGAGAVASSRLPPRTTTGPPRPAHLPWPPRPRTRYTAAMQDSEGGGVTSSSMARTPASRVSRGT